MVVWAEHGCLLSNNQEVMRTTMFFIKQPSFEKGYRLCYDKGEEGKNGKGSQEKPETGKTF